MANAFKGWRLALISAPKGRTDGQTKELEKEKDEARANLIKIRRLTI